MGLKSGNFSFNIPGGRCETCKGAGKELVQMKFLPDFYIECKVCSGKRFNKETLKVKLKGKSVYEILEMTVEEALPSLISFQKLKKN